MSAFPKEKFKIWVFLIVLTVLSIIWWGWFWIVAGINSSYHPNAYAASYGFQFWWVFALLVAANLIGAFFILLKNKMTKGKVIAVSMGIFLVIVALQLLSIRLHSDYSVTYYIDDDSYIIPWAYNPINGSEVRGGNRFVVRVSYPGFMAQYKDDYYHDGSVTLSKTIVGSSKPVGLELMSECETDAICQPMGTGYFVGDGFFYSFHYQGTQEVSFASVDEITSFKTRVVDLFDSFEQ